MTDTALVGGICVDIRKSMSRFVDAYSEFVVVEKTPMINTKTEQLPPSTLPTELRLEAGAYSLHVPRDVAPQWLGLLLKELAVV